MIRLLAPMGLTAFLAFGAISPGQEAEFQVDFSAPGQPISPSQVCGMNDHGTSDGAWRAWSDRIQPKGALARIWRNYYAGMGFKVQMHAAEMVTKMGMDILFVPRGDPSDRNKDKPDFRIKVPSDPVAWAELVATDVRRLERAGARVHAIEIWNEPEAKKHRDCDKYEFAIFAARAGLALRAEFPNGHPQIGGLGVASAASAGFELTDLFLQESAKVGFHPDFLSMHQYGGLGTDILLQGIADGYRGLAEKHGHPRPELYLSEWNLEMPPDQRLDGPESAAFLLPLVFP